MTVGGFGATIVTGQGSVFGRRQPQKEREQQDQEHQKLGHKSVGKRNYFELDGRVFVEEEGEDGAEGGGEEEEAGDGEEDAGWMGDDAVDSGDACAGVGEDEAEECEADPSGDVKASARGGDGENDHDGEAREGKGDD